VPSDFSIDSRIEDIFSVELYCLINRVGPKTSLPLFTVQVGSGQGFEKYDGLIMGKTSRVFLRVSGSFLLNGNQKNI